MPEKIITFFNQKAKVACDGNCKKAWGIGLRPKIYFSENPSDNSDNYAFLSDNELGVAPADPGSYEGGIPKPMSSDEFPNKWCVRQCERCAMSNVGKYNLPIVIPDFSERIFNIPSAHGQNTNANQK